MHSVWTLNGQTPVTPLNPCWSLTTWSIVTRIKCQDKSLNCHLFRNQDLRWRIRYINRHSKWRWQHKHLGKSCLSGWRDKDNIAWLTYSWPFFGTDGSSYIQLPTASYWSASVFPAQVREGCLHHLLFDRAETTSACCLDDSLDKALCYVYFKGLPLNVWIAFKTTVGSKDKANSRVEGTSMNRN